MIISTFANVTAAYISAEQRAVAVPNLNVTELSASLNSAENLFMKNIISHTQPMSFMLHRIRFVPEIHRDVPSEDRYWVMNMYAEETAPKASPATAALFHRIPLDKFLSIFIGFGSAKIEKFSYLCRLVR